MRRVKAFLMVGVLTIWGSSFSFAAAFKTEVQYARRSRTVTISLNSSSSLEGCTTNLFGSRHSAEVAGTPKVSSRILSKQLISSTGTVTFASSNLPRLLRAGSGGSAKMNFYVRAKVQCGSNVVFGRIAKLPIPTVERNAVSFEQWRKVLKRKIAFAEVFLNRILKDVSFSRPLDLQNAGDGSNRIFIVEQGGKIWAVKPEESSDKSLFLDISDRISDGQEQGLLGLAFHPNFKQNGFFYVNYTEKGSASTVIARFTANQGLNTAEATTEQRLLTVEQPYPNHKGGALAFGNDGMLYFGLGDGGSAGDPLGNGQNRSTLLGDVMRIDVDNTSGSNNYAIPSDNPYVGNTQGFREEIFAYGFRNPFKLSFDKNTGKLWVGDVGQDSVEEIDIVESAGNYGWNITEGNQCYPPNKNCDKSGLKTPIDVLEREEAHSIIGGYVYRGSKVPKLLGKYIFADFVFGDVWKLAFDSSPAKRERIFETDMLISSLGVDEQSELYLLSFLDGKIYRFESSAGKVSVKPR